MTFAFLGGRQVPFRRTQLNGFVVDSLLDYQRMNREFRGVYITSFILKRERTPFTVQTQCK